VPENTDLTLALVLTAGGATAAAALVTGVVQLLKQLGNFLDGKERLTAFILSGVLVVVAVASAVQDGSLTLSIGSVFAAVLAWYGIARLAMAVFADATKEANSLTGPSA